MDILRLILLLKSDITKLMQCFKCGTDIKTNEPVFGNSGEFYCANCFAPNMKDVFSGNKRNFYKDRKYWNEKAKQSMKALTDKIKGSTYAK